MTWKIKQKPEDFVVREIIEDTIEASWREKIRLIHGKSSKHEGKEGGKYLWFRMKKRGVDFYRVAGHIYRPIAGNESLAAHNLAVADPGVDAGGNGECT